MAKTLKYTFEHGSIQAENGNNFLVKDIKIEEFFIKTSITIISMHKVSENSDKESINEKLKQIAEDHVICYVDCWNAEKDDLMVFKCILNDDIAEDDDMISAIVLEEI
ncbi:hypothetical protein [Methanobrevibacter sp. DSM 116169]|uniref:hypothetical protein n=1 Tax=Methanobrevibacter sp. DSM 116169 TaxID=3242727 RepID=UPI0038FC9B70